MLGLNFRRLSQAAKIVTALRGAAWKAADDFLPFCGGVRLIGLADAAHGFGSDGFRKEREEISGEFVEAAAWRDCAWRNQANSVRRGSLATAAANA